MTGRTTITLAAAAVAVAVFAIALAPLLHRGSRPDRKPSGQQSAPPTNVRVVSRAGNLAAQHAVACPPAHPHQPTPSQADRDSCGPLTVIRSQATCTDPDHCQVELIGTLTTATLTAPVALTVALRHDGTAWTTVAVTS